MNNINDEVKSIIIKNLQGTSLPNDDRYTPFRLTPLNEVININKQIIKNIKNEPYEQQCSDYNTLIQWREGYVYKRKDVLWRMGALKKIPQLIILSWRLLST